MKNRLALAAAFVLLFSCLTGCVRAEPVDLHTVADSELVNMAFYIAAEHADAYENYADYMESDAPEAQKTLYVAWKYDMEVQNGGLCQFFVNPSRALAPYLEDVLHTIRADSHRELFHSFVQENDIDINDLSSFIIRSVDEFQEQNERYPFDDFDKAFMRLPSIYDYMFAFVKAHMDEF